MADGKVTIDTELNSDGAIKELQQLSKDIKKSTEQIVKALENINTSVNNVTSVMQTEFSKAFESISSNANNMDISPNIDSSEIESSLNELNSELNQIDNDVDITVDATIDADTSNIQPEVESATNNIHPEVQPTVVPPQNSEIQAFINNVKTWLHSDQVNIPIELDENDLNIYSQRIAKILNNTKLTTTEQIKQINEQLSRVGGSASSFSGISNNLDIVNTQLKSVEEAGKKAGNETSKSLDKIKKSASGTVSPIYSLKSALKGILATVGVAFSAKKLLDFGNEAVSTASAVTEVQNVVDTAFGDMSYKMEQFADTSIEAYGMSKLTAKETGSTFMDMASGMGLASDEASNMAIKLTGLTGDLSSFYNVSQDVAKTALESVFTGETETLKKFGIVMTQVNLQQYALSQGITKNVSAMTQAELTQLRYNYVMAQTAMAQGDFAKTSNSWANQTRILSEKWKEFLSIMGNGIIKVLTPCVQALNNVMSSILNVANALAKVFGFETITASANKASNAIDGVKNSTDGVTDATNKNSSATKKNTKEKKKSLAAYDDLQVIQKDTSDKDKNKGAGIPGAGSGAGLADFGNEAANTESIANKLSDALTPLIEKFKELQSLFVKGFKIGLGNDWQASVNAIRANLASIKQSLSEIFNDPAVKNSANNMINAWALALGEFTGSVTSIGLSIAQNLTGGISKYLQKNKPFIKSQLVQMFDAQTEIANQLGGVSVAIANIAKVLRGPEATSVTASLIGIFSNASLGIQTLMTKLGADIVTTITQPIIDNQGGIKKALKNTFKPLSKILGTLETSVTETFETIEKVYDESVGPLFDSITSGLSSILKTALKVYNENIAPVLDKLSKKFDEVWKGSVQPTINKAVKLFGKIAGLLKTIWEEILVPLINWIIENVVPKVTPILEKIATTAMKVFGDISKILGDVFDAFSGLIDFITGVFTGDWKKAFNGLKKVVKSIFKAVQHEIQAKFDAISGAVDILASNISAGFELAVKAIKDVFKTVSKWFADNVWEPIKKVFKNVGSWFKDKFDAAVKGIKSVFGAISAWFDDIWTKIKEVFKNVGSWFSDKFKNAVSNIKDAFSGISKWFGNVWANIKEAFKNVGSWFKDKFTSGYKGIKSAFSGTKKFFSGVWSNIKDVFAHVASWFKNKFSKAWEAVKKVFSSGGKVFDGIKDGILSGLKSVINKLIDGINKVVKIPFDGLNESLGKLKKVDILGQTPFNFLPTISVPKIPHLAQGAVIPANKEFLAMLGDQKHGTNIEAPLDTIVEAFKKVIGESEKDNDIIIQIDGKEVFRAVKKQNDDYKKMTGKSQLA